MIGGTSVRAFPIGGGTPLSDLTEGTLIKIPENGTPVEFYVSKINYEESLNGAGRVLVVRKDVYDQRVWDSGNVNAYASSDLDSWFNSTYKNMLEADIRSLIGTTKIRYTPGNGNDTVGTLERAIFALSLTELGISHVIANVEGSALPIASILQIAYQGKYNEFQWTRSPLKAFSNYVWALDGTGGTVIYDAHVRSYSRPCFTLPSTTEVDNNLFLIT